MQNGQWMCPQAFSTSADATLRVAADADGWSPMRPSKVVYCT